MPPRDMSVRGPALQLVELHRTLSAWGLVLLWDVANWEMKLTSVSLVSRPRYCVHSACLGWWKHHQAASRFSEVWGREKLRTNDNRVPCGPPHVSPLWMAVMSLSAGVRPTRRDRGLGELGTRGETVGGSNPIENNVQTATATLHCQPTTSTASGPRSVASGLGWDADSRTSSGEDSGPESAMHSLNPRPRFRCPMP
jgi:hypothetical protein